MEDKERLNVQRRKDLCTERWEAESRNNPITP